MAKRWDSIFFTIVGVLLSLFSLYQILHHRYEFYLQGEEGGWTSNFAYLGLGFFFFVTGLIGWVRSVRGKVPNPPEDQPPVEP